MASKFPTQQPWNFLEVNGYMHLVLTIRDFCLFPVFQCVANNCCGRKKPSRFYYVVLSKRWIQGLNSWPIMIVDPHFIFIHIIRRKYFSPYKDKLYAWIFLHNILFNTSKKLKERRKIQWEKKNRKENEILFLNFLWLLCIRYGVTW